MWGLGHRWRTGGLGGGWAYLGSWQCWRHEPWRHEGRCARTVPRNHGRRASGRWGGLCARDDGLGRRRHRLCARVIKSANQTRADARTQGTQGMQGMQCKQGKTGAKHVKHQSTRSTHGIVLVKHALCRSMRRWNAARAAPRTLCKQGLNQHGSTGSQHQWTMQDSTSAITTSWAQRDGKMSGSSRAALLVPTSLTAHQHHKRFNDTQSATADAACTPTSPRASLGRPCSKPVAATEREHAENSQSNERGHTQQPRETRLPARGVQDRHGRRRPRDAQLLGHMRNAAGPHELPGEVDAWAAAGCAMLAALNSSLKVAGMCAN
jgi:hypothetical protein